MVAEEIKQEESEDEGDKKKPRYQVNKKKGPNAITKKKTKSQNGDESKDGEIEVLDEPKTEMGRRTRQKRL